LAKPQSEVFKEFEGELNGYRETLAFACATYKWRKAG